MPEQNQILACYITVLLRTATYRDFRLDTVQLILFSRMGSTIEEIKKLIEAGVYLTPKQAALFLGLTVKTLADYRCIGRRPEFIKRKNAIRYPANAVLLYHHEQLAKARYSHALPTTQQYDKWLMRQIRRALQ